MVKSVYVPEAGGIIDFPDEATPKDIVAYVDRVYGGVGAVPTEQPTGPDESTLLGRAAYGFATGFTDIPSGIAALAMPAEQVAKTTAGRFSEDARKYLQETFGIDPTKDPTAAQQAAEALGSVGSFLVPATGAAKIAALAGRGAKLAGAAGVAADALAAQRAARLAGSVTAAGQGVALGAAQRTQTIQQQLASGMEISPEEQLASQRLSGLIGASEALPLERFFGPLTQILSKVPASKAPLVERIVKSRLSKITRAGVAEGAQEAASGIANDLMEYGVYNPDVEIGQDLLSNAGTGAFAGSFVEGVIQLAAGRKLRGARQLQQDIAAEKQQNAIAARQGLVSDAAEKLRQYNIDGPVEVVEDEIENVPIFSLKTPAGNVIGEFADRDSLNEAVGIYNAKTGAKVEIREPAKIPDIFPVKIGKKKFDSLDAVRTERDNLISRIQAAKVLATDPIRIKEGASKIGVSEPFYQKKAQDNLDRLVREVEPLEKFVFDAEPPQTPRPITGEYGPLQTEAGLGPQIAPSAPLTEAPIEPVEAVSAVGPSQPIGATETAPAPSGEGIAAIPEPPSISEEITVTGPTPVDTTEQNLSAGLLPEVAAPRKPVRQIEAETVEPRDYTPEQKALDQKVYSELRTRLSSIVPAEVALKVRDVIDTQPGYLVRGFVRSDGTANDMKVVVEIAQGVIDPRLPVEDNIKALMETLNHEIIHVVRRMGLIRPAEWNILSRAARSANVPGKKYTYLDKAEAVYAPNGEPITPEYADPEVLLEEAVAEMYKDWVINRTAPKNTAGLFNRITEFFRRIFRTLKSNAQEGVFKRIESGEVGQREAATFESGERFSAAPIDDASWTEERIDREIRTSGYYDGRSKAYVGWVNPRDFIAATDEGKPSVQRQIEKASAYYDKIESIAENTQSPYLRVSDGLEKVTGHEGRHRMAALARMGVEAVPVVVTNYKGEMRSPISSLTLLPQGTAKKSVTVNNLVPLSTEYRSQIIDMMSKPTSGLRFSASPLPGGSPLSRNLEDKESREFGLYPYLRTAASRYYDHKPKITGTTNPNNAAAQIANLDQLLRDHPNALASDNAWADYAADALGRSADPSTGVPLAPYKAVLFANNPRLIADQIGRMTPGQLRMAEEGLSAAKEFEQAYKDGTATPVHTAKLILWGILSRGVSPFVQESMFLDVVKPVGISNRTGKLAGGIDQFIQDAIDGEFDLEAYKDYVRTLKIDGLPGAGTTHNLGAFGETTLVKLQQRVPDGRTLLQYLHDLIQDYSLSGKDIRRLFHTVNPGIGINNKVLSFVLLVTGRDDVMVLDRVQMRNQFNDGTFNDYNLYDGIKIPKEVRTKTGEIKTKNVTDTGSGIAHLGDGIRGLMYYEALERDLAPAIRKAYGMLNRGNQYSMGRYHWESWVATSAQEVDHGSISGLLKDAVGEVDPYRDVYTGEGKYNTYNSGMKYGYTDAGEAYIGLPDGLGRHYYFTPEYAKKVVEGYEKRSTGIIRDPIFKVSTSVEGPWYDRPEVDKQKLRNYLRAKSEEFRAERGRAFRKRVQEAGKNNATSPGPGPVNAVGRRGGVRQPVVTDAKSIADKYVKRDGGDVRFSAAPIDPDEFRLWFRKSKVVNKDGSPKVMYHGTSEKVIFKSFNTALSEFGTHFGSARQANEFVMAGEKDFRKSGRIIPVFLSIQNPLRLRDTGAWSNDRVASQLLDMGLISESLADRAFDSPESTEVRAALQDAIKAAGYDGVVYLNRAEGINKGSMRTIEDEGFDWREMSDQQFKAFVPEAEDSYIIFDGRQAKSTLNEFRTGERARLSFSAAPLPSILEQKNKALFAPAPKKSFKDMIFDFFLGEAPTETLLTTQYGQTKISALTRAALIGRTAAVDRNAMIEFLEKQENLLKTGDMSRLTADYSPLVALLNKDRASHLFAAAMLRGNIAVNKLKTGDILSATLKVEDSPDNLMKVFELMLQPGPPDPATNEPRDKREIFRLYATAMRAIGLKADGKRVPKEMDDNFIKTTISFTEQNYPEIVEAYKMYQRFNRSLLKAAVDAELITPESFANLTKNMDYYGYYYEVFEEVYAPGMPKKVAGRFNLRPYKGTELGGLANDPMQVMLQNSMFWTEAIAKNLAARKSFELARRMGVARLLNTGEDPDRGRGEEDQVMFFRDKGVDKRFAVSDPLLVSALGSDDRIDVGKFWEMIGLPTQVLRETITRDPGFMVANLMRDTLSAWITSGADIMPFIGTVKGFANAYKNGASFQALQGRGVVGSYDLAMLGPADLAKRIRSATKPKGVTNITSPDALIGVVGSLWNRLGAVSEMSDAATRIAVYESAIKQGFSEAEAAFRALEIMNFSRRGASQTLSILTKLVPFLNARIQGMDVLYQAGKGAVKLVTGKQQGQRDADLGKKFLIRGGMLAAISVALEMLNDDDEDYQQLDDYIKNSNVLIPLAGFGLKGQFIAVPKPFEAGLLFSTFPQQFYKSMTGQASTRENAALFFSSFASTFGVNPIPQFMLPPLEVIVNHDFYTGLPLISEGKARLAPELQYNSGTSSLAMMIGKVPISYNFTTGKFEGVSPIVIDNLISGYTGPFGTYIVQAASLAMEGVDAGPERLPRSVSQLPVVRRFFIDSEYKNPKVVSQAYELFRVVDEANRSYSRLRQIGDAEAVKDYLDENRDILSYKKYVFKLVDGLNKLSAQERRIESDQTMTREEKFEAMAKLRETRMKLAAKVTEINAALGR